MVKHELNVYIEPKLKISIKETWFKSTLKKILAALSIEAKSELGLVITNNEMIRQLNKTYRDKDTFTDVLAFSMVLQQSRKAHKTLFTIPPDGISHLGEVVISYPQVIVQAEDKKHGIEHELLILMIHGVLHLLGYDHEQSREEERRMRAKEDEILKMLTQ